MATKYVVELTKAQLSMIIQAMHTHSLEIDCHAYTNSEIACFDRASDILMNRKTKAEYLGENKNA